MRKLFTLGLFLLFALFAMPASGQRFITPEEARAQVIALRQRKEIKFVGCVAERGEVIALFYRRHKDETREKPAPFLATVYRTNPDPYVAFAAPSQPIYVTDGLYWRGGIEYNDAQCFYSIRAWHFPDRFWLKIWRMSDGRTVFERGTEQSPVLLDQW
jgi:hypothetical protein